MKKLFYFSAILFAAFFVSCSEEYDDSALTNRVDNLENRVERLEELCAQMNTNITSLQTIVNALQQKDYITAVAPINKNGAEVGYTITFSSGKSITIYHGNDGKDGADGSDGKDGADGKDGHTPIIGVKQASDGVYYWTVDGEWLLDADGNKIKAQSADSENGEDGEDGADGADGKDGITPQLKIEADYWYVSYDEGKTWTKLGKATGEDGADGSNGSSGDTFFQDVTEDDKCVYFTLADGTVLTVAKYVELQLFFDVSSLKDVKVNSEVKVDYTVTGSAPKVEIEVMPSNDLRAEAVADDATKKSGHILIRTGSSFDSASKVVVLVSDGDKVVMKSISLQVVEDDEAAQLYVYNGATKNIGAAGGAVTLSFLTNVDCEAVIPDDAKSWISVASVRALENKHITLNVAQNTSDRRSAKVKVQSLDGKLSVEYTISQAGTASSSTPEAGDDGTILGTPAGNEIFYTSGGSVVEPYKTEAFGAVIVSNTYVNGVGVIVFDREITEIGYEAFYKCYGLSSITIPDSVTTIGGSAFYKCSNLRSITIPDSVTGIGYSAFYECSSLTNITIPDGVTSIGERAFQYCSSLKTIIIPDSVTSIGSYTFENCKYLKNVNVKISNLANYCTKNCMSEIPGDKHLFIGKTEITNLTIPNSVTEIGYSAFYECSHLTNITIPDSVTEIRGYAFRYCRSLTSVTIGNSVTSIGYNAFEDCTSLTTITIPNSVTEIGGSAFDDCSSLKTIIIPDSVTEIGGGAFYGCQSLIKAVIGSGVKNIGSSAFKNCIFLNEIICKPTTPPTGGSNMFKSIGTSAKIYVPVGSGDAYKAANYWSDYASIIEEKAM